MPEDVKQMAEDVVREELETLDICVQGDLQLRTGRRAHETSKTRPLTPHFIVSVARGPEVAKLRSLTKLCGLVSVETHIVPKGPLQCKRYKRFGNKQHHCGYAVTAVLLVVGLTSHGSALSSHFRASLRPRLALWLVSWFPVSLLDHTTYEDGTDSVPKRRYIKFRRRSITQKKEYNISVSC
jgi:hypothetical protein